MEKITIVLSVAFAILMGTLSIGYNSISLQTTSAQMMGLEYDKQEHEWNDRIRNDVRNERREYNGID